MNNPFKQATKQKSRLRLALIGTSGSGKTWTALTIACRMAERIGGRVALIDTESGSAGLYADHFDFDALNLTTFSPQTYIDAIHAAEAAGYPVIVIDSLTHAWSGKEGALELVDKAQKRGSASGSGGNSFTAWRDVTPLHNAMIDAIVGSSAHVIATMRAKTEYLTELNERGKMAPRKVGMAPVQRDGMEYEFTVVGTMDAEQNSLTISKSRLSDLAGAFIIKPGADLADQMLTWLDGASAEATAPFTSTTQPEPQRVTKAEFPTLAKTLGFTEYTALCSTIGIVAEPDAKTAFLKWLNNLQSDYTAAYGKLQIAAAARDALKKIDDTAYARADRDADQPDDTAAQWSEEMREPVPPKSERVRQEAAAGQH